MKYKYVLILGRPGCGKSALYRELEQRLLASGQAKTFERVDDSPKLWANLKADDALEAEGKERIYIRTGGIRVRRLDPIRFQTDKEQLYVKASARRCQL